MIVVLWCTATTQPAIHSEVFCILGAEGCVVDVNFRGSMRWVAKYQEFQLWLAEFPSMWEAAS